MRHVLLDFVLHEQVGQQKDLVGWPVRRKPDPGVLPPSDNQLEAQLCAVGKNKRLVH